MRGVLGAARWAVAVALVVGCGECTWCAGRAAVTHEEHGRTVVIDAQGFRDFGVGAMGAPHAFGIIYPEFQGSGYRVRMTVDDRPPVGMARIATEDTPSAGTLDEVVDGIGVRVSESGDHVAIRFDDTWHVFFLLEAGTPFALPASIVETEELDLASFPRAEDAAHAFLSDESANHDQHQLFWDAVAAAPPDVWDDAVLGAWPHAERAHDWVRARLAADATPPPSAAWRAALDLRARAFVEEGNRDARVRAVAILAELGGESLEWLDTRAITTWRDVSSDAEARTDAQQHLEGRLRAPGRNRIGAEPLPDASNSVLVDAARAVVEERRPSRHRDRRFERRPGVIVTGALSEEDLARAGHDLDLAFRVLDGRGTDADRSWRDEVVLDEWPATGWIQLDDALMRRIAAHRDDDTLRRAVTGRAARGFRDDGDVRRIAAVLFAWRMPDTDDQALRGLLDHLDEEHWDVMRRHLDRASPAFERDAVVEARRILDAAEPLETASARDRSRAARATELVLALTRETADCTDLRDLEALHGRTGAYGRLRLPSRCTTPSPTAPGTASTPSTTPSSPSSD